MTFSQPKKGPRRAGGAGEGRSGATGQEGGDHAERGAPVAARLDEAGEAVREGARIGRLAAPPHASGGLCRECAVARGGALDGVDRAELDKREPPLCSLQLVLVEEGVGEVSAAKVQPSQACTPEVFVGLEAGGQGGGEGVAVEGFGGAVGEFKCVSGHACLPWR